MWLTKAVHRPQVVACILAAIAALALVAVFLLTGSRTPSADAPVVSEDDLLGSTMADVGAIGRESLGPSGALTASVDAPIANEGLLGLTMADVGAIGRGSLNTDGALTAPAGAPIVSDDLIGATMADVGAIGRGSLSPDGELLLAPTDFALISGPQVGPN